MKDVRKGSEFHNIGETWDENERNREMGRVSDREYTDNRRTIKGNDLDRKIKEEADEYDLENKEDQVMGGERASVNDEPER